MNILALSGSLRSRSVNSAMLRVAAQLAPSPIHVQVFGLGELPLFNPDLEADFPTAVLQFHTQVAQADALLIASPEYAHGVTGVMKNALDWLVSFEPFCNKPVAVINTSPRAYHADAALKETLRVMSANLIEPACITLPLLGRCVDEAAMLASDEVVKAIREVLKMIELNAHC